MSEPKPLDLDNETKIPDNELAQSCFEMILRALISDEKEFDTEEEALDCIFSLLSEFKDEIKKHIESACRFYLKYKDAPLLLVKDWDDGWDSGFEDVFEFIDEFSYWVGKDKKAWKRKKYNEWLFKLAFNLEEEG